MNNNIKIVFILLNISLLLSSCVDDTPELKSFYKMNCDELMTKQAELKEDIGSNSLGVIISVILDDNNIDDSQRETNNLKRDLRDVQRAIYDRKCDWDSKIE